jgi:hypothetical protein
MAETIDLDEVEDRLDILEQVVDELRRPTLDRAERQILMTQYSHLEEVLLQAVNAYISMQEGIQFKLRLPNIISRLCKSGAEFQETWKEEFWGTYEQVHGGTTLKQSRDKPANQTTTEINQLQDLALTLSKLGRDDRKHIRRVSLVVKPQTLSMVDLEAKGYMQSKRPKPAQQQPETQSRCRCLLM